MRRFDMYTLGKLVRSLRKQRGLTQADLAEQTGIDTATLSKIENGHSMPNKNTIANLLHKLNFDPGGVVPILLSEKEARHEELKSKIYGLTDMQNPEHLQKLKDFLAELEKNVEFYEDDLNRQWAMKVKAGILLRPANIAVATSWGRPGLTDEERVVERENFSFSAEVAASLEEALETSYEAIRITIPIFDIKKTSEYYFSSFEMHMVSDIANAYYLKGQEELAVDAMKGLVKSIDSDNRGTAFLATAYPTAVGNLCNYLMQSSRHEEVLEYSSNALTKCIQLNLPMVPRLAYFKGWAMLRLLHKEKGVYDIPEAEEAKAILRDAYHGCRLIGNKNVQSIIEGIFAVRLKTKVDGTPL